MHPEEIAQSIAKKLEAAWNNSSGKEFEASFTSPTDFIDITGTHHKAAPREAIGAGHQAIFDSIYKGSNVKYEITQALKIDDSTILAHMKSDLDCPAGPLAGRNNSIMTMVIVPENGEWRIRAFHNTLVRERGK